MRDYARISPKFWIGNTGTSIKALGANAQLVAIYLLTSPHSNMIGLYWQPVSYISEEVGISLQGAEKALASLSEIGFCAYDLHTKVVWVKEMARYQIAERLSPKDLQVKGVQNAYNEVPGNPFLSSFFELYSEAFCMSRSRGYEGACKVLESKEKEKAQAQEKEKAQAQEKDGSIDPKAEPVISIPLHDGTNHLVFRERLDFWVGLYPAVDVMQELRKMVGWTTSNPTRRKTARGVEGFVTTWLSKAQDSASTKPALRSMGESLLPADSPRIPSADDPEHQPSWMRDDPEDEHV